MLMEVQRLVATGADETAHAFGQVFSDFRIGPREGRRVEFELEIHEVPGLKMLDYRITGPELELTADGAGFAAVQATLKGEVSVGGHGVDTTRPFLYWGPARMTGHENRSRIFLFPSEDIRDFAPEELGRSSFLLDPRQHADAPVERAAIWTQAAATAAALFRAGLLDDPLISSTFVPHLMALFLSVFPTNWADAGGVDEGALAVTAPMRRAKAYIEEHHAEPMTVADIAGAARMSIRGLQAAFRREYGATPTEYLRRVRLDAARRQLLDGDPASGTTVGAAARAAGFAHPSRFAAAYRDAFGELPGETLRN